MTEGAESSHDSGSAPSGEQRKRRRQARRQPLDAKSMDRAWRLLLAFPRDRVLGFIAETSKGSKRKTNELPPDVDDLAAVHAAGSVMFGTGDGEDLDRVLQEIGAHTALQPLNPVAKVTAGTYIFQARASYRLKKDAKYWVLRSLGKAYPYPLAIRTGTLPSWKRQIRSLQRILLKLQVNAGHALLMEHEVIMSSRADQMPAGLILSAESALQKAIRWMRAFRAGRATEQV